MNSTSLHALIVDQHFGELSPEVAELLESHLAEDAEARAEADRIRQTLAITERVVLRHPELVGVPQDVIEAQPQPSRGFNASWLAKAASIVLLVSLASAAGFVLGRNQNPSPEAQTITKAETVERPPRDDSPWARYRFAPEPGSAGAKIVRVDTTNPRNSPIR